MADTFIYQWDADPFTSPPNGQSLANNTNWTLIYQDSTSDFLGTGSNIYYYNSGGYGKRVIYGFSKRTPLSANYGTSVAFVPPTAQKDRQYFIGCGVRMVIAGSSYSGYVGRFDHNTGTSDLKGVLEIARWGTDGVGSIVATSAQVTLVAGDVLKTTVQPAPVPTNVLVTLYLNGVSQLTYTDSSSTKVLAANRGSVYCLWLGDNDNTSKVGLDNYAGWEATPPGMWYWDRRRRSELCLT